VPHHRPHLARTRHASHPSDAAAQPRTATVAGVEDSAQIIAAHDPPPRMCGTMKAMNATENTSHDVRPMWVST
jgi:hypothetical protein